MLRRRIIEEIIIWKETRNEVSHLRESRINTTEKDFWKFSFQFIVAVGEKRLTVMQQEHNQMQKNDNKPRYGSSATKLPDARELRDE